MQDFNLKELKQLYHGLEFALRNLLDKKEAIIEAFGEVEYNKMKRNLYLLQEKTLAYHRELNH